MRKPPEPGPEPAGLRVVRGAIVLTQVVSGVLAAVLVLWLPLRPLVAGPAVLALGGIAWWIGQRAWGIAFTVTFAGLLLLRVL